MTYDINKHIEQLKVDQVASEAAFKEMIEFAEKDAKVSRVVLLFAALLMVVGTGLKLMAFSIH